MVMAFMKLLTKQIFLNLNERWPFEFVELVFLSQMQLLYSHPFLSYLFLSKTIDLCPVHALL